MPSTLIASRPLRYNARPLVANQEFNASARDARLLIALGRAKLKAYPEEQAAPVVAPTAVPAPSERQKRQYRRRDMTAADASTPEPVSTPPARPTAPTSPEPSPIETPIQPQDNPQNQPPDVAPETAPAPAPGPAVSE